MILYMLLLMGGTYLPKFGVPVTLGYPILREGYSGYAVAYAVVAPTAFLLFLNKKYAGAVVTLATAAAFLRVDRIVFVLLDSYKNLNDIHSAGKLAGVYVGAVIAALMLKFAKNDKINWRALLIPSVFVAYICENLRICLPKKRSLYGILSV